MVVPPCPLCECDDYKEHPFKKGCCVNCKHVHDPKMKAKRVKRKKVKLKKCVTCGKTVYRAEMLEALNKVYHTSCFKCISCAKTLSLITYKEHKEQPYCQPCFGKTDAVSVGFGPGRVGKYVKKEDEEDSTKNSSDASSSVAAEDSDAVKKAIKSSSHRRLKETDEADGGGGKEKAKKKIVRRKSSKGLGGDNCVICGDRVYAMEKMEAIGKIYHEMCFKCTTCKKRLTLITYSTWKDEPYCKPCFGRTDGTAHGYGLGAAGKYKEKTEE
eukprot:g2111.t1